MEQELETAQPRSIVNMDAMRSELVRGRHELVAKSEFRKNLGEIQDILDKAPAPPKGLGLVAQATNEKEMHRQISFAARNLSSVGDYEEVESWAANSLSKEARENLTSTFIAATFTMAAAAFFLTLVIGSAWMLPIAIPSLLAAVGMTAGWDVSFRNRVIKRKEYKREVGRLLGEAERVRQRNDKLREFRKRYLEEAKTALRPVREDFELMNPGHTLSIVDKNGDASIEIKKNEQYSKLDYIAARGMVGGPVEIPVVIEQK